MLQLQQPEISKIEHRTDMYISTLRDYIRAMGGDLEIVARFPDGEVGTLAVLIWPGPVDWVAVAVSFAALFGVLARVQWSYYKKHV